MKDFSPHAILRSDLTSDEEVEWLIEAALIRRGGEGPVTREADWQEGFDHLKSFVKREKHARVPLDHTEDGFRLGTWVGTQRSRRKTLAPARVQALEDVKGWIWDAR